MIDEIKQMQAYLEIQTSTNPEELQERIATISVYKARSGEMYAEAKKALRRKKSSEISNTIIKIAKESHLSASVQNALLDSICEEESFLVDILDRLNAACTLQIDALRTLLSYAKEELRINKTGY